MLRCLRRNSGHIQINFLKTSPQIAVVNESQDSLQQEKTDFYNLVSPTHLQSFLQNYHLNPNLSDFAVVLKILCLEPVFKLITARFFRNFERLFGKILLLYLAYCKKFFRKTNPNLWKRELG